MGNGKKVLSKSQHKRGKVVKFPKGFHTDLAGKLGVSVACVYRVLGDGSREPSWPLACRIADELGISLDQLRRDLDRGKRKVA